MIPLMLGSTSFLHSSTMCALRLEACLGTQTDAPCSVRWNQGLIVAHKSGWADKVPVSDVCFSKWKPVWVTNKPVKESPPIPHPPCYQAGQHVENEETVKPDKEVLVLTEIHTKVQR